MMEYKIYGIVDLRNDMPVYIGSTKLSLKQRFSNHCTIKSCTMYRYIKENGRNNFEIILLRKASNKAEAIKLEEEYTKYFLEFTDLLNKDIGNKHSDEHNQKIGKANSKPHPYSCKKVKCVTTDEVFDSILSASQKYSIPSSNIVFNCQNKRHSAGGYKWKYVV